MSARVRQPVAVLLSRFPLITETFILREIIELERQGQPVVLVPMIRENPEVVHEEAKPWIARAVFTPWISLTIVMANLRALWKKPGTYLGLLAWIAGGALFHPGTLGRSLLLFPKSVYLAEELVRRGVAHLHAHFATHPATMATIVSAFSGIPFSITIHAHDIFVERVLLRRKIADALFIRAISSFNRHFLENLFPAEAGSKIRVVHVGIEPEKYRSAQPPQDRGSPRLLCIAALKPYKGVPFLITACKLLVERGVLFRCDIIGAGPMRASIRRSVVSAGLHDRVRLRGALPQHVVADEVRRSDVFVLPSIIASDGQMEGIPVALMEAMAAGKPVVTTAISGIPELVEHETSGLLVDPGNPRSLADAIERLIADPRKREAFGAAARRKVEEDFDLRTCVTQLLAVLDELVEPARLATDQAVARIAENGSAFGVRSVHRGPDANVYDVVTADPRRPELIVKEHLSRAGESRPPLIRARDEYATLVRLGGHFTNGAFGVPRAVAISDAVVAMSRADGTPLDALIREARRNADGAALRKAMQATGSWLDRFQHFESSAGDAALDAVATMAVRNARGSGSEGRIVSRVHHLRDQLRERARPAVAHHGDFWPGNVFVSREGRVEVIDFEGYALSLAAHDITWFLFHTSLYFAVRGTNLMETVREAFFDGYDHALDPAELELCRLATALQLAARDDSHIPLPQRLVRRRLLRKELAR